MRWELGEDGRYHKGQRVLGPRAIADRLEQTERSHDKLETAVQTAQRVVGALASGRQPTPEQVAAALQWLKSLDTLETLRG